jgi:hypothetical protein
MKHVVLVFAMALCFCGASFARETDHAEVGVFADYFRLSDLPTPINFVGVGGRAGFNVHPNVQIEAEMAYNFERNFTSTTSNGITTNFVRTGLRPLSALFGPKFQTNRGPFRAFVTFKAGLVNFSSTTKGAVPGFTSAVSSVTTGNTHAAIFPGGGVEGFWGPFGLRLDAGDEIYFDNGAQNNLKMTFGPVFRF